MACRVPSIFPALWFEGIRSANQGCFVGLECNDSDVVVAREGSSPFSSALAHIGLRRAPNELRDLLESGGRNVVHGISGERGRRKLHCTRHPRTPSILVLIFIASRHSIRISSCNTDNNVRNMEDNGDTTCNRYECGILTWLQSGGGCRCDPESENCRRASYFETPGPLPAL